MRNRFVDANLVQQLYVQYIKINGNTRQLFDPITNKHK